MKKDHWALYPPGMLSLKASSLTKMVFYRKTFPVQNYTLIVKPLCLDRDLSALHQWVNDPASFSFRQLDGTLEALTRHYMELNESGNGYSLVIFMKNRLVAQVDFYHVDSDEIKNYYDAGEDDHCINMLMPAFQKVTPKLSVNILITSLAYLFTLTIERVILYPATGNDRANKIIRSLGFKHEKQIQLTEQTVNLYCLGREEFLNKYP